MHSDLLDILRVFSHYKVEYLISKEDLIAAKMAAGRPQDLVDVQTLTAYQSDKKSKE
jgi:hypothetical protein